MISTMKEMPMVVTLFTDKTVSEAAAALQIAVQANYFGVMQVHNLKETMAKKGRGVRPRMSDP
jgi:hypothetical protein